MEIPKLKLIWQYLDFWEQQDPDFPSVRFGQKLFTAKELNKKTDQLAKVFLTMGIKKGDTIVTVLPTIPEFVLTFFAASKIGAITVPMDKEYKKGDFRTLIPHSAPKVIVTIDKWQKNPIADNLLELSSEFEDIKYIIVGNHELGIPIEALMAKEYDLNEELQTIKANQDQGDCTLVIWTGGTTGNPKAVKISHANIIYMCLILIKIISDPFKEMGLISEKNRLKALANLPVSHIGGTVECICTNIINGNEMILHASWSPWNTLKTIKKEDILFYGGVPTMFKIFLSLPDLEAYEPKKHLKLAFFSGEKVSQKLLEGIHDRLCENIIIGYGSTEAGAEVTTTKIGDDFNKIAEGYVGKPLQDMEVIIIDEQGNRLPLGKKGEILVKGPLTSKSYFKMPEEDKMGFNSDGYCKTGDIGYLDEKNGLYISGRIKHIIRVGAFTVFPPEIEDLVVQHPKVALAAALGVPDELKGEVVWLVIGPEFGKKFDESDKEEILNLCKDNLAKFKVPQKIIIYPLNPNDLPITRIGKVDRVRLRKELISD
ncbi:MAG: class I adenylate-forming enzyme family protein [Promethearchaeota archaeon]